MINFKNVPYTRLDMEVYKNKFINQLNLFKESKSFEQAYYELIGLDQIRQLFATLSLICEARNTMNVNDEFYKEETEFFDKSKTEYEALENEMNEALLASPFKDELINYIGTEPFMLAKLHKDAFSLDIMDELIEENLLSSKYSEIVANVKATTEEGIVPLSKIGPHIGSKDRKERSKYSAIWEEAFAGIGDELDELYDKLVNVRARIAKKLGKKSFTEVGYCRMGRTSYDKVDIKVFRDEVKKSLVPIAAKLFEKQRESLGVDTLYNYDEDINVFGDNIKPSKNILEDFREVYKAMSPETHVYYENLVNSGFYDLEVREGKIVGAYSNYIPLFHMPFIFETYNATTGALKTFAHETGHGFHSYCKSYEPLSFSGNCGSDLAEIHSMGMEFLVWPYLKYVLPEEHIEAYKYTHIKNALAFIPYGCAADEFQEIIYDNPELSPAERKEVWKKLEKDYLPWKNYEKNIFFGEGRAWQKQTHIYRWPFYYIDYVLAQVCALQIHFMNCEDSQKAWTCYKDIINLSGQKGFKDTILEAGLKSPFEVGVMEELANNANSLLSK